MAGVAIVTDSISCIPSELVKKYNIRIVPVGLVIDHVIYQDTILTNERFWELFYQTKEPITTNAVSPGDFKAVFIDLSRQTDSIICILVSAALSATYESAVLAAKMLKSEKPDLKIEVIDSVSAAGAEGFIVLEAAKAAREGKDMTEIVEVINKTIPRVNFLCAMDTLKYLIRSGRAPRISFIGDIMKIKPIVSINKTNGLVENVARARGMDKAIEKMVEMIRESITPGMALQINVHYRHSPAAGVKLKKAVISGFSCSEVFFTPYTPVMASQCGPVLAVSYYF